MKYLMWDIDGTLLLTGGAGKDALIKVIKDFYFLDAFDFTATLAGRTDSSIIRDVVVQLRGRFLAAEAAGLLIRYHTELPRQLPLHKGRIMSNVEKTLQYFQRPDSKYLNCLLTGNTKSGAKSKLDYYKLSQYFSFDHSIFGELNEKRDELARIALQRLYVTKPDCSGKDFIFIGDTPSDVNCAKAIDARCLVVLEGSGYSREDFAECQPWKIIDILPEDPAELEKLFDEE